MNAFFQPPGSDLEAGMRFRSKLSSDGYVNGMAGDSLRLSRKLLQLPDVALSQTFSVEKVCDVAIRFGFTVGAEHPTA